MLAIKVGRRRGSSASAASLGGIGGIALLLASSCGDGGNDMTGGSIVGAPTAGMFGAAGTAGIGTSGAGGTGVQPPPAGTGAVAGTGAAGTAAGVGGTGASGTGAGTGAAGMATAGTGGASGTGASGAGASGTGGGDRLPALDGPSPMLPAIEGECPQLMNGTTIMVAGHGGIAIAAGAGGKNGALLFYWHGTGGSASAAMRDIPAAVRDEILATGGIIASFNGRDSSGTAGDCSGTAAHNMADFNAADQIAACAVRDHGIDPRRIYSTGCSAGGLQSGCMAMVRSSYLAAAAPNSGGIVFAQPWEDANSPAIFTMHGGSSDVVIVTFSQTSRTLDMSAKTHGSFVVNCDHGGGHCAAPAELKIAAWQFMKDHPWGVDPSPWMGGIPDGVPDYCTIF